MPVQNELFWWASEPRFTMGMLRAATWLNLLTGIVGALVLAKSYEFLPWLLLTAEFTIAVLLMALREFLRLKITQLEHSTEQSKIPLEQLQEDLLHNG